MRDLLAERLLGTVLGWSDPDHSRERPILTALARLKYDEYQQYTPGMKFIESLAFWLNQFDTVKERQIAYRFIRNRLIFLSAQEMNHLVDVAFPKVVKPILFHKAALILGIPIWRSAKINGSTVLKELRRRSLFLGLSDGAHIDRFRRTNNSEIGNEQILPYYDISPGKVTGMKADLRKSLAKLRNQKEQDISEEDATFKSVFLLDDFSASGLSMLRNKNGFFKGKLEKIQSKFKDELSCIIDQAGCDVYSIIYVMTVQARQHLEKTIEDFWEMSNSDCYINPVMVLNDESRFGNPEDNDMKLLVEKYYDHQIFDEHFQIGGTYDAKTGFAGCGLPVILSHNTPNDSLFILWSYSENFRGLFPRTPRHREG